MRKLVTIREITAIDPIVGADFIETATIDGWEVVIKKGEFNVGDKVLYFEIDSFIPHILAPWLSKGNKPTEFNGVLGERLRTVKLRGQISQGLVLPISILEFANGAMLDKIYVDHGSWDFYYDSIEDAISKIRQLNDGVFPSDPPLAYFAPPVEVKVLCNFSEFVNDMLDVAFEGKAKQLKGEKELIDAFQEFEWVNRDVLIHYPDYDRPIKWSDHVWYV